MLHQFESTLTGHCPEECEQQYFEPVINSDSMIDSRTANRFGALRSQNIAVIEMRYSPLQKKTTRQILSLKFGLF